MVLTITEEDVRRAARILRLPESAFEGPRREVLQSMNSMDVAACPGSGKTTLLVAKLAILADKWRDRTRGICVLSHTNVARNEVETRLGHSTAGRRLLSYPHYIGTIHGFVNEFLALPWLRSQQRRIKRIDTALCQEKRWARLKPATRSALQKNNYDAGVLSIKSPNLSLGEIRWGKGTLGKGTPTYQDMQRVCQISLEEGFHCYDEMFMWAHDLIARTPECAAFIRDRFPVLFLDEAQDNSEDQSALLALVFRVGGTATLRQRFGDSNQAIFDSIAGSGAVTDKFPESSVKRDLPDSHRFGQRIADLAAPLGLDPQQLKGKGPATSLVSESAEEQHTLFLFGNGAEHKVLSAYAEVLLATFSNEGLAAGSFIAVGQVHRPPVSEDPAKTPQHIGQYWPEYSHELTGQDPKPATLRDYILLGIAKTLAMGETRFGVEAITSGIMRLVSMTEGKTDLSRGRLAHQQIVRALSEHATIRRRYEYLICRFILKGLAPSKPLWEKVWTSLIKEVVETVAGAEVKSVEALQFLAWSDATPQGAPGKKKATAKYNVFKYPPDDHKVSIRVGSIHSVKGETCTAALILETFWYTHNLTSLRPWLDGSRFGAKEAGERDKARLKLHYVGFSRPTHLLCVAMKESSFWNDKGELDQSLIARMEARGWRVKLL